ncbi:MAG: GNAT family N-acetyltransferase [Candidatus Korarchaeota archaeon]|nr:GNAT family N-acetyltransferase [Candidatus Korarchaeota archaeon]NIU85372.1 GNAT family N-acetyltransferase [Candidatus Thorarchaeota archaeon]NIW15470.1 GNAT family N-acetyltransferase [Candidatus Thorarchaeota archaeon]NIW53414.1 GNAT family N-acetyltransferase [Candidatus Korarchaeota archaeon]
MKVYSHKEISDPHRLKNISQYTKPLEALQIPYWIFEKDEALIGLVAVGREPLKLIAPPGTPLAIIHLVDPIQVRKVLGQFSTKALKIGTERNVDYIVVTAPYKEKEITNQFQNLNFETFDDAYRMACSLEKPFRTSDRLQFRKIKETQLRDFLEMAPDFLQGSPDVTLRKALQYMGDLPDKLLHIYHRQEAFYYAKKNDQNVGILTLNFDEDLISNIGVKPAERGKGYGREIMIYGLSKLKEEGSKQAYLRVHVDNAPAIGLYESVGFSKIERFITLLWKK